MLIQSLGHLFACLKPWVGMYGSWVEVKLFPGWVLSLLPFPPPHFPTNFCNWLSRHLDWTSSVTPFTGKGAEKCRVVKWIYYVSISKHNIIWKCYLELLSTFHCSTFYTEWPCKFTSVRSKRAVKLRWGGKWKGACEPTFSLPCN